MNAPDFIPVLAHGGHPTPEYGACLMEMVSFIEGEEWSDTPQCVEYALAQLARNINDFVSDDNRSKLVDSIHRFSGTAGIDSDEVNKLLYGSSYSNGIPHFLKKFHEIKRRAQNDKGEDRLTNEQYDQIAIDLLYKVLDGYDALRPKPATPVDFNILRDKLAAENVNVFG